MSVHAVDPFYWLGRLSMALALQIRRGTDGLEVLEEFIKTRPPDDELRRMLREELKRK